MELYAEALIQEAIRREEIQEAMRGEEIQEAIRRK